MGLVTKQEDGLRSDWPRQKTKKRHMKFCKTHIVSKRLACYAIQFILTCLAIKIYIKYIKQFTVGRVYFDI